jgi:hypothetical protein
LELEGKSANVVFDDADLDQAPSGEIDFTATRRRLWFAMRRPRTGLLRASSSSGASNLGRIQTRGYTGQTRLFTSGEMGSCITRVFTASCLFSSTQVHETVPL